MVYRIIMSISSALQVMESHRNSVYLRTLVNKMIPIMMHKLRGLRTFLICSTILRRAKLTRSKIPMHKPRVLGRLLLCSSDNSLGSLLLRVDGVVSRILDTCRNPKFYYGDKLPKYLAKIESFQDEMEIWYTNMSDYLQECSSPAVPDQVWDITYCIVENLEDFLTFHRAYVGVLVEPIEALKENITFLRNFIRFSTLLCAHQHQEFHDLLTLIQPLAISAAHLTVHLFSATHYNAEVFVWDVTNSKREFSHEGMKSMISALLLCIKPVDNPHLYETYTQALRSIKNSRELYVPTLNLKDFITFLLSTLWEMLQLDTSPVVSLKDKLQALYEGLGFLTTILKKQPNKFVDKIRNMIGTAIFDAGVIIFSLHKNNFAFDRGFQYFQQNIQVIRTKVLKVQVVRNSAFPRTLHWDLPGPLKFSFPKTTGLGFLDFLLDCLTEVRNPGADSDTLSYLSKTREYIIFLRSCMGKLVELGNPEDYLHQTVWNLAVEVAYKIELLIDQLVLGSIPDSFIASFHSITVDIMIIRMHFMTIDAYKRRGEISIQRITWTSTDQGPSQSSAPAVDEVVGFEIERSSIIHRLRRGSKKLHVVAIVGMPGLGKTTLATKVYNDHSVGYHFHARVWCSVSQVFNRRKVLLELLNHIKPNGNSTMDEDDLSQQLWRSLKGRRYLIFIDDIWDMQAFDCLKESFPDDSNGSRILLTSRQADVAPEDMLDDKPLYLRELTEGESMSLLQRKLFPGKDWPPLLYNFGMKVARYCKGLPITILIVAGILTTTREEAWEEILESLRSGITSTLTDECVNSMELSYKHLPHHLKPCFLSFGAFPEDHVVSVRMLIWQWIAEGFVRKSESKRLEEVATDYLNILIGRSLVMIARERSRGGVMACRIHDLLHDFCLRKASEELFLHVLKSDPLPFHELSNLRRLCIHSKAAYFKELKLSCPRLRSLLFFNTTDWKKELDMSFIFRISKLLRVLAMKRVHLTHFPCEIGVLVQLRYLAIDTTYEVSPSIGNLTNLESLIFHPKGGDITLPDTFWNMQKLRHLYSSFKTSGFKLPVNNLDSFCNLLQLDSLSSVYWHVESDIIREKQLRKFPNIRQLKCRFSGANPGPGNVKVMSFSLLSQLESLSLFSYGTRSIDLTLPESIRKLVLDVSGLSWETVSTIAELPNLEVLKLRQVYFIRGTWHVEEGEFSKLKFLELESRSIVKWTTASDDQFSNLEKLVLIRCSNLEEIPECLQNVATLEMIEVTRCPRRVASLVKKVEDCQKDMGNSALQVHVRDPREEEFDN